MPLYEAWDKSSEKLKAHIKVFYVYILSEKNMILKKSKPNN